MACRGTAVPLPRLCCSCSAPNRILQTPVRRPLSGVRSCTRRVVASKHHVFVSEVKCRGIYSRASALWYLYTVCSFLRPVSPTALSIAPFAAFRLTKLLHLSDSLLELFVLALFVAVALVLSGWLAVRYPSPAAPTGKCWSPDPQMITHLALPWSIPSLSPALVEGNEKAGAAVTVSEWQTGLAHLLAGCLCDQVSECRPFESGENHVVRLGCAAASEPMIADQLASGGGIGGLGRLGCAVEVVVDAALKLRWNCGLDPQAPSSFRLPSGAAPGQTNLALSKATTLEIMSETLLV